MTYDEIGEFLEHQGLSDEQIDKYFEHFGTKGQKWGVRRQNRIDSKAAKFQGKADRLTAKSDRITERRSNSHLERNLKIAGTVAGAAAIAVGAVYANKLLKGGARKIPIRGLSKDFMSVKIPGGQIEGNRKAVIAGAAFVHQHMQELGQVM